MSGKSARHPSEAFLAPLAPSIEASDLRTQEGFETLSARLSLFLYRFLTCIVLVAIFGLPDLASHFWRRSFSSKNLALAVLVQRGLNLDEPCLLQLRDPSGDAPLSSLVEFGEVSV